jgi:CRP-like cAMP-binding protein
MSQVTANRPNRILANLGNDELGLLKPFLQPAELGFKQRIESPNRKIKKVYFIESGIVSNVAVGDGHRAEIAIVGFEGMTGVPVVLGAERSPNEAFIQAEGRGQCITSDDLRGVMEKSPKLSRTLTRYAHALSIQVGHTALASARGNIEERLARWLLMAHDRLQSDELVITHEFLSLMLAVRRAGVTIALQELESRGLIETARGAVNILDRDGLEECSNGLYGVPEGEFERLFPN